MAGTTPAHCRLTSAQFAFRTPPPVKSSFRFSAPLGPLVRELLEWEGKGFGSCLSSGLMTESLAEFVF